MYGIENPHLRPAVGQTTGDWLGSVHLGIRSDGNELGAVGILEGGDDSAEEVDLGRSTRFGLETNEFETRFVLHDTSIGIGININGIADSTARGPLSAAGNLLGIAGGSENDRGDTLRRRLDDKSRSGGAGGDGDDGCKRKLHGVSVFRGMLYRRL